VDKHKFHPVNIIEKSEFFSPDEFPPGALDHMAHYFIVQIVLFRSRLGAPIMPSPIPEGWFRATGSPSSRHYAVGRQSDAGDIFPLHCDIRRAVMLAVRFFSGVGFYLDTRPTVMLHVDMREDQTLWCRVPGGVYIYAHREPDKYFKYLSEAGR
jgi:hypothetical protein